MKPEIIQKLVDRIESLTGEDPFYTMITRDEITLLVHLADSWASRVDALEKRNIDLLGKIRVGDELARKLDADKKSLVCERNALRRLYCESEAKRRRCSPETVAVSHRWLKLYPASI